MHLDDPVSLYLPDFANVRVYSPTANGGKGGAYHVCLSFFIHLYVHTFGCLGVCVRRLLYRKVPGVRPCVRRPVA